MISTNTVITVLFSAICVILVTGGHGNGFSEDSCFCKLQGEVDDCSCKIDSLDDLNNNKIYPRLKSILSKDFFRYIKMNFKKPCPFWADDSKCALKDCHVNTCKEDEVPEGLKGARATEEKTEQKYTKEAQEDDSCEDQEHKVLGALDTTISAEKEEAFKNWTIYDDAQETFCEMDDDASSDMEYVDLLLNPERYTGYKGESPWRIWRSIYDENCFKPPAYGFTQALGGLCLEKRVFHRLISGLHTSINIHLSADYLLPDVTGFGPGKWGPNAEEFQTRFDPKTTEGAGPQRLKNLYFTYLVELRALVKAAPYLEQEDFFTGNSEEDADVKQGVTDLIRVMKSFPQEYLFDESKLFQGDQKEATKLKEEFRNHFMNISRIMDCVGCDKCKLWGKVQVLGMGTALKILFSGDSIGPQSTVSANQKLNFQLRRTEIVALLNAFGRLSKSIRAIEMFKNLIGS